jgi:hypothetical protein
MSHGFLTVTAGVAGQITCAVISQLPLGPNATVKSPPAISGPRGPATTGVGCRLLA